MWETDGDQVRGEFSSGPAKALVDGRGSLTLALDQYKYGDELIAQLFTASNEPVMHERHSDGYTRTQVYLGTADLETAAVLEQIAATIRERHAQSR